LVFLKLVDERKELIIERIKCSARDYLIIEMRGTFSGDLRLSGRNFKTKDFFNLETSQKLIHSCHLVQPSAALVQPCTALEQRCTFCTCAQLSALDAFLSNRKVGQLSHLYHSAIFASTKTREQKIISIKI
jgi:hypothetical protein